MSLRPFGRVRAVSQAAIIVLLVAYTACSIPANASQLSGWVFIDRNNDGQLAFADEPMPDYVINGVKVSLFQIDNAQEVEIASTLTNDEGYYAFTDLAAGTYSLRQTQPVQYVDGLDSLGTLRSLIAPTLPAEAHAGTTVQNGFINIVLPENVAGEMYNFGELGFAPGYVSKRLLFASAPPMPTIDRPVIPEPCGLTLLTIAVCIGLGSRGRPRRGV